MVDSINIYGMKKIIILYMGSEKFDNLPSITEKKKNVTKAMFEPGLLAPDLMLFPH